LPSPTPKIKLQVLAVSPILLVASSRVLSYYKTSLRIKVNGSPNLLSPLNVSSGWPTPISLTANYFSLMPERTPAHPM